jgi:hypothetical protein
VWNVKEQLRVLPRARCLAHAAAAKNELEPLAEAAGGPETNELYRTVRRWWNEIEVLMVPAPRPERSRPTTPESLRSTTPHPKPATHATGKKQRRCPQPGPAPIRCHPGQARKRDLNEEPPGPLNQTRRHTPRQDLTP